MIIDLVLLICSNYFCKKSNVEIHLFQRRCHKVADLRRPTDNGDAICPHSSIEEACIGVLGIQDICHFTSRDIAYFLFYFQGYRILCSIFWLISGILNI